MIGISQFATREWMRTTKDKDVKAYTVYNCVNEDKFKKRITPEERERIRENLDLRGTILSCFSVEEL